jgi:lipoprotein signal peptidase
MEVLTPPAPLAPPRAELVRPRQSPLQVGALVAVGCGDQLTKAWAWRHLPRVHINSGSGLLLGPQVGRVYRDGLLGLAVDLIGTALLLVLAGVLLRRPRPTFVFVGAALALGGWASNLADRLALHAWTAPGSARGVVDFVRWHGRLWNLADFVIIAGCAICVAAWVRAAVRPVRLPTGARMPDRRTTPDRP